jgi:hypothetical protein
MDEREFLAIEARAKAATDGPWRWEDQYADSGDGPYFQVRSESVYTNMQTGMEADDQTAPDEIAMGTVAMDLGEDDARFIAHARTDVPALLTEIRRLRALLDDS